MPGWGHFYFALTHYRTHLDILGESNVSFTKNVYP
ncbi:hypothetical protein SBA4_620006 [Candidatus Sulfopaludibacter sp. SbA4]|nr:hypothetical protein SBA4_620006 [Candidatus Sulfopaludibacter sp. SbA4]